jgi:hypothetical protein
MLHKWFDMSTARQRRRARWIGAAAVVVGVASNLYASALAAFQMAAPARSLGSP